MTAKIFTHNVDGKVLLICSIFSFNEIDGKKKLIFFLNGLGFHAYETLKFVTACFFWDWNCSDSPFLEVCKLTDLMAAKVGRFTDLGAVLLEYYRAKSSNS